jgi:hypothetical protein
VAHNRFGPEATLRAYLLAEQKAFLHQMVSTLLEDGPESAQYGYAQLGPRVDALAAGAVVRIHRYELPEDHPLAPPHGGHPLDSLLLDEHDMLRAC